MKRKCITTPNEEEEVHNRQLLFDNTQKTKKYICSKRCDFGVILVVGFK